MPSFCYWWGSLCILTFYWWKWSSWGAAGKIISWDPHRRMGFCGKLSWWCKIKGGSLSRSYLPPSRHGKSPVLSSTGQSFCSILKHSLVWHLVRLACAPSCGSLHVGLPLLVATWQASTWASVGHGARECKGSSMEARERERILWGL